MKQYLPRGKRIRATDKDLVFHTATIALLPVFLLIVLLFHGRSIMQTDWQDVTLRQLGESIRIPYLLISMGVAGLICLAAALVFRHYCRDYVKQLYHRQKLAKMVLENKWYEAEQVQSDGFFKDLSSSRSKEKISYFPKIYYQLKNGLIHIRVEITLGKYQDQLLHLEKKLESGLYCELTDKELKDSYVEYTLLYDTIANRISIEDVQAKGGRLRLMKNIWWEYDKLPHNTILTRAGITLIITIAFSISTMLYTLSAGYPFFLIAFLQIVTFAGIYFIPLSEAKAGDLVFFHSTYNAGTYITHVGIYQGNNRMFHAGDPIGYADLTSSYWQQHLASAGRIPK